MNMYYLMHVSSYSHFLYIYAELVTANEAVHFVGVASSLYPPWVSFRDNRPLLSPLWRCLHWRVIEVQMTGGEVSRCWNYVSQVSTIAFLSRAPDRWLTVSMQSSFRGVSCRPRYCIGHTAETPARITNQSNRSRLTPNRCPSFR